MWPFVPLVSLTLFAISQLLVRRSDQLTRYVLKRIDRYIDAYDRKNKRKTTRNSVVVPQTGRKSLQARFEGLTALQKIEWGTRIASSFHALLVFPIVFYIVLIDPDELPQDPLRGVHDGVDFVMACGIGYFVSDALIVVTHWLQPVAPVMVHHVLASVGFAFSSYRGFGRWFCAALLLTEASNPFNNLHWKMEQLKLSHTPAFRLVGYGFAWSWVFFRLLPHPFILAKVFEYWSDVVLLDVWCKILLFSNLVFLISLNYVFFFIGPPLAILRGQQHTHEVRDSVLE